MASGQEAEGGSINRRDGGAVLAAYGASVAEQPLSPRTREVYVAAVRGFLAWLGARAEGVGEALGAPRARDLAARDYKRHLKVERGLSPASVNQALAAMDHLFRFLGLGAAIVTREELPRAAPRALDVEEQRALLRAAEEASARDRAIVALPVTAEIDYLLGRRFGPPARRAFLDDLAERRYEAPVLDAHDYAEALELDRRYASLDLGLADLSVAVLARKLGTRRILTFDERHFRALRPLQGGMFTLLPADRRSKRR